MDSVLPAFSSDSGLSACATSEHADISGLSAGSSALVQGIPRANCAVTHSFRGVEPVPRTIVHRLDFFVATSANHSNKIKRLWSVVRWWSCVSDDDPKDA